MACRAAEADPSPERCRQPECDRRARPGDVFDLLLAPILECDVKLVAHLVAHHPAAGDPAWLGQRFQPGGNVDAIAEDILIVDNDVAEIDADAELDAVIRAARRHCARPSRAAPRPRSAPRQRRWRTRRAARRRSFSRCDRDARLSSDRRAPQIAFRRACVPSSRPHQARITRHIGGEDRGEAAGGGHSYPALGYRGEINPNHPPLGGYSSDHRSAVAASEVWITSNPSNSGWPR